MQAESSGITLRLANSEGGYPEGRLCLIARIGIKAVTEKNVESELACSIVAGPAIEAFRALLTEIYLPSLASQESSGSANQRSLSEFLQVQPHYAARTYSASCASQHAIEACEK